MPHSTELFIEAIKSWGPISSIIDEGLTEGEIEILCRSIAEILSEHSTLSKNDKIALDLEDFLYDVLEEYGISVSDEILQDLVNKIINTHNRILK